MIKIISILLIFFLSKKEIVISQEVAPLEEKPIQKEEVVKLPKKQKVDNKKKKNIKEKEWDMMHKQYLGVQLGGGGIYNKSYNREVDFGYKFSYSSFSKFKYKNLLEVMYLGTLQIYGVSKKKYHNEYMPVQGKTYNFFKNGFIYLEYEFSELINARFFLENIAVSFFAIDTTNTQEKSKRDLAITVGYAKIYGNYGRKGIRFVNKNYGGIGIRGFYQKEYDSYITILQGEFYAGIQPIYPIKEGVRAAFSFKYVANPLGELYTHKYKEKVQKKIEDITDLTYEIIKEEEDQIVVNKRAGVEIGNVTTLEGGKQISSPLQISIYDMIYTFSEKEGQRRIDTMVYARGLHGLFEMGIYLLYRYYYMLKVDEMAYGIYLILPIWKDKLFFETYLDVISPYNFDLNIKVLFGPRMKIMKDLFFSMGAGLFFNREEKKDMEGLLDISLEFNL